MTKVIILGEEPQKQGKKIEFKKAYISNGEIEDSETEPCDWQNIELICEKYTNSGLDLMFAYDTSRKNGILYFGYFNDGIV